MSAAVSLMLRPIGYPDGHKVIMSITSSECATARIASGEVSNPSLLSPTVHVSYEFLSLLAIQIDANRRTTPRIAPDLILASQCQYSRPASARARAYGGVPITSSALV